MDDYRFAAYDEQTRQRIREFQGTRDPILVPPILRSIACYYLPPGTVGGEAMTTDELFAVVTNESLTRIEVLLDTQDAFGIRLEEKDLAELRSAEDFHRIILAKAGA